MVNRDSVLGARNGPAALKETRRGVRGHLGTSRWAETAGGTPVVFEAPGLRTLKAHSREQGESLSGSSGRKVQNGELDRQAL